LAEIYNFNNNSNEEESEYCCPSCELAQEYFGILLDILQNKTLEDSYSVIRELVEEAKSLALIEYLQQEIENKAAMLDHLVYGECEEDE
jgi:hypothetical protein